MKTRACYIRVMVPTIALFDIDGTLLRAGGAGRRAVELALDEVLGGRNNSSMLCDRPLPHSMRVRSGLPKTSTVIGA